MLTTPIIHHIFRTARFTNFKLGIRMQDGDPHQPQALRRQRSRSQGHAISLSVLAQCCTCVIRGRQGHIVSAEPEAATLLVIYGRRIIDWL